MQRPFRSLSLLALLLPALLNGCGEDVQLVTAPPGGPTLVSLSVQPAVALSAPGSRRQYHATATFSDGSVQDVTSQVNWSSNDSEVIVDNNNLGANKFGRASIDVNAATGQQVQVSASLNGLSDRATLTLGAFAYSANLDGDTVTPFTIDTSNGALSAGTSVNVGDQPRSIAIHPTGLFAYVANLTSDTISTFAINPTSGALSGGSTIATGTNPGVVVVDPSGRFVYTSNVAGSSVSIFGVNQVNGELTALATFALAGPGSSIAMDPRGRFAYVCDQLANTVQSLNRDVASGALAFGPAASATGLTPFNIAVHPEGRFLYTSNLNGDNVTPFTIATDGTLTPGTNVNAGDGPSFAAVDPSGRFLYAANLNSNNVSVFTIDAGSGALVAGTAEGVGTGPRGLAVDPSGRFVYTANRTSNNLSLLTINQASGALTFVGNTPAGTGAFAVSLTP